ncbi:MAG: M42 family metallopeptidase [Planctomycetota bacterium]|jgi:endoglucanase
MRKESYDFLRKFIEAPSPSGYEVPAQKVFTKYVKPCSNRVDVDVMGNTTGVIAVKNAPRIMLAGHMDEIGLMVKSVTEKGFLTFSTVGGFDRTTLPSQRVNVWGKNGAVLGVIGKKAVHMMKPEERNKAPEIDSLFIDIGAKDKKAAEKLVSLGDVATFACGLDKLQGDVVTARCFDDKMGAFLVAEILRALWPKRKKLQYEVHGTATVQEEVGLRGARTSTYNIDPKVGICLEVGFATDHPGGSDKGAEYTVGGGPIIQRGANMNHKVFDLMIKAAKKTKIKYQVQGIPGGTGTDTNAMQLSRSGVATSLISIPIRYMHTTVETLSTKDLDASVKLVSQFILDLKKSMSFIPK